MEIITRSEAKSLELIHYFTGKLCKSGHLCIRYVKNGTCVKCKIAHVNKFRKKNPEYHKKVYKRKKEREPNYYREMNAKVRKKAKEKNPNYYREINLKTNYGITLDDYNNLLEKQNYRCAICNKHNSDNNKKNLFVDHCHKTGIIRGLLCSNCNSGLALLGDNFESVEKTLEYLKG